MISLPPKITELELEIILNEEVTLPDNLDETFIEIQLIRNPKIKWVINPFILRGNFIRHFSYTKGFKQWKLLKLINWLIVGLIIFYSIINNDYNYLWSLILYALLVSSGIWDLWIGISLLTLLIGFGLFIKSNSAYYWFNILIIIIGYSLSKVTLKIVEQTLIKFILSDTKIFWNCFVNKIIISNTDELISLENLNAQIGKESI